MSQYKEGTYSSVSVFKNRIEFRNVGNLYGSNTLEKIISARDVEVRNKTTVGILEILGGVLENRHTGVKTMITEMDKAKLPKPVFENQREDFVVTFYNGEYQELYPEQLMQENTQENAQENAQEKSEKRTRKASKELILKYCKEPKTIKEITQKFGYKNVRNFRERYINPLLEEGKLKMTIPEQPKNRNQKYITTEQD